MIKRTIWTIFTLVFMVSGVFAAVKLADIYLGGIQRVFISHDNAVTAVNNSPANSAINGKSALKDKSGRIKTNQVDKSVPVPIPQQASLTAKIASGIAGLLVAYLIWSLIVNEYRRIRRGWEVMPFQDKVLGFIGFVIGLLITVLLASSLKGIPSYYNLVIAVVFCYLSVAFTLSIKEQFRLYFTGAAPTSKIHASGILRPKILDTNVIIDGRIADICKAGFVEGPIYVPRFVLEELQQIADSSDSLKRARGRRGLDILNMMQQEMSLQVETFEAGNGSPMDEVDAKLVLLAKELDGSIVTNDFNLNKVAVLQGVKVLNVNELANALKPVVLPGEEMAVTIIKEGKEQNQGIGYLDDGTMIVVEHAKQHIGQTTDVIVTSILQTPAGKMIFAIMKNEQQEEEESIERNIRSYSGSRQRRKIR